VRETLLAKALDALPHAVFLYDRDLRVHHANAAARRLAEGRELDEAMHQRGGELLRCVNSRLGPSGCGSSAACERCLLRQTVAECLVTQTSSRAQIRLERDGQDGVEVQHLEVVAAPFEHEGQLLALVEFTDVSELVTLRSLLPVCAACGSGRLTQDLHERTQSYLSAHPEVSEECLCGACEAMKKDK
jgi:PAS domain-containing protein